MARPMEPKRTAEATQAFLEKLSKGFTVGSAAYAAGIARQTAYAWRDADPEFAADWDAAIENGNDFIEDMVRTRGVGFERRVVKRDGTEALVDEYSDSLLALLVKGRMPEKFGTRRGAAVPRQRPIRELSEHEFARRIAFLLNIATSEEPPKE